MADQVNGNGAGPAGRPADALSEFLQVAGGAATELATERAGDARVSAAFSLGWQMAELYRAVTQPSLPAASPAPTISPSSEPAGTSMDPQVATTGSSLPMPNLPSAKGDLPGISKMTPEQRDNGARKQIDAALAQLTTTVTNASLTMPNDQLISQCVSGESVVREACLRELHIELLSTLTAADIRIGKAYGLGRALSDTCRSPRDGAALRKRFKPSKVARLRTELDDLATAFPPHAANAVNKSLCRWSEILWPDSEAADGKASASLLSALAGRRRETASVPPDDELLTYARRQSQMWRALLSGEKCGVDMLRPPDYIKAAGQTLSETRILARQLVSRFPVMTLLVVVLFAGGIALLVQTKNSGSVIAGVAGVLASAGITWKGIGARAGGIAGLVEQHLWGAELDTAICDATFMLGGQSVTSGERRTLAKQVAQGKKEVEADVPPAISSAELAGTAAAGTG
jgi:hypothetical protein